MTRRALVIGSQTFGLTGVHSDVERVARSLLAWGVEVEKCVQDHATRAGILAAYQRLIDACEEGDCALVYYSGHGARIPLPESKGPADTHVQLIIPTDFGQATDNDFRGITAPELSALQGALTSKTRNVVVVMDCCHSSAMSRGLDDVVRSLGDVEEAAAQHEALRSRGNPWPQRIAEHLARLRERGVAAEGPFMEANPYAVRLAASGVDQSAWEYTNAMGVRTGILTECFLEALLEARMLTVSWDILGRRIREQVLARRPTQRPEIEGPVRRVLFGLEEPLSQPWLPYFTKDGRHGLRGGLLHGVQVGDEYALMPFPAMEAEPGRQLASAQVIHVLAGESEVALTPKLAQGLEGAVAFLTRSQLPRRPVAIDVVETGGERLVKARAELEQRLANSSLVCCSVESGAHPDLARVCFTSGAIELRDQEGALAAHPMHAGNASMDSLINRLETMARAQTLRELESGTGTHALTEPFCLEWGRVLERQPQPLPIAGALLTPGERFYVRIRNEGTSKLYVSVFDVGVSGRIFLLNQGHPSGMLVEAGMDAWLGKRPGADLEGIELAWPDSVPNTGVRGLESLVVIVATAPQDLTSLQDEGVRNAIFKAPESQLESLVRQAAWGDRREAVIKGDTVRYAVRSVAFLLKPPTRGPME